MTTDEHDLINRLKACRTPESAGWDRMRSTPGDCLLTIEGGIPINRGYHWDIPRDAWNALFLRFGESRALIEIQSPSRPFAGTPVWDQPHECLDTWQRWIAKLS